MKNTARVVSGIRRMALMHEWLVSWGGSEQCLVSFLKLFPSSDLYTVVYDPDVADRMGLAGKVRSTFIQRLPRASRWYRKYLPLMPLAVEQLDFRGYDLILSGSHAFARAILARADQMHVCYCHTPARYAWDLYHQYMHDAGLDRAIPGLPARAVMHYLRLFDAASAGRVDWFIANSNNVAHRIRRVYGRESAVIYPPVDVDRFKPGPAVRDNFFLVVSRLVPYKKVDLVVQAFADNGLPLVVIGDGPGMAEIKQIATGKKNVEIIGWQPPEVVADYMARARALVFAADEDFGIVPVEAQACGTPVIAYGSGGALETVKPLLDREGRRCGGPGYTPTGIYFPEQAPGAITTAVMDFISLEDFFSSADLRSNAAGFARGRFESEIKTFIEDKWEQFGSAGNRWI